MSSFATGESASLGHRPHSGHPFRLGVQQDDDTLYLSYASVPVLFTRPPRAVVGRAFDVGTSAVQWCLTGYLLTVASLLLVSGSLADRFGRRRILQAGLLIMFGHTRQRDHERNISSGRAAAPRFP